MTERNDRLGLVNLSDSVGDFGNAGDRPAWGIEVEENSFNRRVGGERVEACFYLVNIDRA